MASRTAPRALPTIRHEAADATARLTLDSGKPRDDIQRQVSNDGAVPPKRAIGNEHRQYVYADRGGVGEIAAAPDVTPAARCVNPAQ